MERKYYEAYDDRYRQVHELGLRWADGSPSPIVRDVMQQYGISKESGILELGCGEGRDAVSLLKEGFTVLATDISPEAICYCRQQSPAYEECFLELDFIGGTLEGAFDFIYAVAVVHMLVRDEDRSAFYRFVRSHMKADGIGLICTMGDGTLERSSDISTAFDRQERFHGQTGQRLSIAGTSCRMVSFDRFHDELRCGGLEILESGITETVPGFSQMMYAVVCRGKLEAF